MTGHQRRVYMTARLALPGASDDEIDYVLWEFTAFPLVGGRELWRQFWHALRVTRRKREQRARGARRSSAPQSIREGQRRDRAKA